MASTTGSSFYVTLPSNSSLEEYPDNTLSSFRVKMVQTVILEGDWEVGLVEMHYPQRWYNYLRSDVTSRIFYSINQGESWVDYPLESGYYDNIKHFLLALVPDRFRENIEFGFNSVSQKVFVTVNTPGFAVKFTGTLAAMLGFEHDLPITKSRKATYPIDMELIHNLYVYCDIVEHQIVGNARAPLLRTVAVQNRHGRDISINYERPHYISVNRKLFQEIEIDIRDATGRKIPFQRGRVIVKLHFRKKAPSLLD